jgi:hypothetical protein
MYADESGSQAMLVAVGHGLRRSCHVKPRGLDPGKTYWIEDITLGRENFEYKCLGRLSGRTLMEEGLYLDLASHRGADSICLWIQAETSDKPQVVYAEPAVRESQETESDGEPVLSVWGAAGKAARLVVAKPGAGGVENINVEFDSDGRASIKLSPNKVDEIAPKTPPAGPQSNSAAKPAEVVPITDGDWKGRFGKTAAWVAGEDDFQAEQNGFRLSVQTPPWIWSNELDTRTPQPAKADAPRRAACWYSPDCLSLSIEAPDTKPYRLTLYVLDYDRSGRREIVNIVDGDGLVLDTQWAEQKDTAAGATLSWTASGSVVLEIEHTSGINAVASAIFVDVELKAYQLESIWQKN